MKSLNIKDLAITEELDSREMSAVRGGTMFGYFPAYSSTVAYGSFSADQFIGQTQNTMSQNGNNVAFATDIKSKVDPHQTATNNNNVYL
ncbi:hypothetical protein ASG35_05550 [Burkholderia sp. Leaf177]|jgi:hypothetical protein|uniref:hypothetical protein n=1 Tax=Burkholderia sp. Leaf177 TaxID=1736287 RepID=UPI0007002BB3|nr:hypothetical protein [Burkholderia sp. Leaf177]KQR81751.1 hypothetical protein ASG35_05550 [Burkholderia sp. Leaf177]